MPVLFDRGTPVPLRRAQTQLEVVAAPVERGEDLARCLLHIDLNGGRAVLVVAHLDQWAVPYWREVQNRPKHHRIIDLQALMEPVGFTRSQQSWHAHVTRCVPFHPLSA